jgi:hypothetical protein
MNITLDHEQAEGVVVAFLKESIRHHLDVQSPHNRKDEDFKLMAGLYSTLEYCLSDQGYQEFVKGVEAK